MPKTKEKKRQIIETLKKLAEDQKVVVYIGISGLKSPELFRLRNELKQDNAILKIAKKTLAEIAFKEKDIQFPKEDIKEPMGFVFGKGDEILPLKRLYQFQKEHDNLKIFGGSLEGQFLNPEQIIELAKLPSKGELLARFVAQIASPIQKFIYVLDYNLKGLVWLLQNLAKNN